jgi:hypothetical protein
MGNVLSLVSAWLVNHMVIRRTEANPHVGHHHVARPVKGAKPRRVELQFASYGHWVPNSACPCCYDSQALAVGVPLVGGTAIGLSIAPEIKSWYPTIKKPR